MLLLALLLAADDPPAPPAEAVKQQHQQVVDAIRNCAKPVNGEIVVCAKDRGIAEGYRLPRLDPRYATNLRPSGRGEAASAAVGASGTGACSRSGAGGFTGCAVKDYKSWRAEKNREKDALKDAEDPR